MEVKRSCIDCGLMGCGSGEPDKYPPFCLTAGLDPALDAEVVAEYEKPENKKVMLAAAMTESEFYLKTTRVQDTMEFAKKIGAKKLGIATCIGLLSEARMAAKIFRHHGFEVTGIICKCGSHKKTEMGIPASCNHCGTTICNPILQAKYLNGQDVDLKIVIGLCVGHDSLFYKYAEGLVTTLIVKDRVLGHNPAAALYTAESYYNKKLFPEKTE